MKIITQIFAVLAILNLLAMIVSVKTDILSTEYILYGGIFAILHLGYIFYMHEGFFKIK